MAEMESSNVQLTATLSCCGDEVDGYYLHSACHPSSPMWLGLVDDRVIMECAECGADLGALAQVMGPPRDAELAEDELEVLAVYHLNNLRRVDFEVEVGGEANTCTDCCAWMRARVDWLRQCLDETAFASANARVDAEWQQKFADIQFYRQCANCGSCEVDSREGNCCPVCGEGAEQPHDASAA